MSRICENCGIHIRGFFTHTVPTVRHDASTGYTYRFCSENCADQWAEKRKQPPPPARQAASSSSEDSRQIEQRWLADGGAGPGGISAQA